MNLLAFLKQSTLYLIRSVERLFVCLFVLQVNLVLFVVLLRVIFGKIASKYGTNHLTAAK